MTPVYDESRLPYHTITAATLGYNIRCKSVVVNFHIRFLHALFYRYELETLLKDGLLKKHCDLGLLRPPDALAGAGEITSSVQGSGSAASQRGSMLTSYPMHPTCQCLLPGQWTQLHLTPELSSMSSEKNLQWGPVFKSDWCMNPVLVSCSCTVRSRPFYLPREFITMIISMVQPISNVHLKSATWILSVMLIPASDMQSLFETTWKKQYLPFGTALSILTGRCLDRLQPTALLHTNLYSTQHQWLATLASALMACLPPRRLPYAPFRNHECVRRCACWWEPVTLPSGQVIKGRTLFHLPVLVRSPFQVCWITHGLGHKII